MEHGENWNPVRIINGVLIGEKLPSDGIFVEWRDEDGYTELAQFRCGTLDYFYLPPYKVTEETVVAWRPFKCACERRI